MAQKKGGGSTRNGRDSKPKMLGVKVFGGQTISAGSIIVRQRAVDGLGVGGHCSRCVKLLAWRALAPHEPAGL